MSKRGVALAIGVLVLALSTGAASWDPAAFSSEDTLEIRTIGPEEGEHWSTVWLVVIDGDVYLRLGSRAAERVTKNTTAPTLAVRIAGQQFDAVTAQPAPEMAEKVAQAMAEKYWSDIVIRYFDHPLTVRLVPSSGA